MPDTYTVVFTELNSLYGAFRLAHWNVVGANFYSAHLLFQRIYEILGAQIDPVAEQIRGEGTEILAESLNQAPEIDWATCSELMYKLHTRVQSYITHLREARSVAQERDNIGFVALLETLLSEANTIQYLLRSSYSD